jgi:hypothetical protein
MGHGELASVPAPAASVTERDLLATEQSRSVMERQHFDLIAFDPVDEPVALEEDLADVSAPQLGHETATKGKLGNAIHREESPLREDPGDERIVAREV